MPKPLKERIYQAFRLIMNQKTALELGDLYEPFWQDFGVPLGEIDESNLQKLTTHFWTYVGASKVARTIGNLDMRFYKDDAKGVREEITDHPFRDLFYRPNPWMTHNEIWEYILYGLLGSGSSYLLADDPAVLRMSGPTRLFPLLPQYMRPMPDKDNFISGYKWHPPWAREKIFPVTQITWFKLTNPLNYYKGLSPLTPANRILRTDIAARDRNLTWLEKGSGPKDILETTERLDPEEVTRMKLDWMNVHSGTKKGDPAILYGGVQYKSPPTPKEMDFAKLLEFVREEELAGFSIPPAVAGIMRYASYANAEAQDKMFWTETIIPYKRVLENKINEDFFPTWGEPEMYMEFDISHITALQEDKIKKATVGKIYVTAGIKTANEVREEIGLPAHPDGNTLSSPGRGSVMGLSARVQPVSNKAQDELWKSRREAMVPHENRMKRFMSGYFQAQQDRIMNSLRSQKTIGFIQSTKVSDDVHELIDFYDEWKRLQKASVPEIKEVLFAAGDAGFEEINSKKSLLPLELRNAQRIKQAEGDIGISFDLTDPVVLNWIDAYALEQSRYITTTSLSDFRNILISAVNEGLTIDEISAKFDELFGWYQDTRSRTIARTEVNASYNRGRMYGYEDAGIEQKQWFSARDRFVRGNDPKDEFDHISFDGQIVNITEPFHISGERLMHPGDPVGSAGNVANCRCVVVAVLPESGGV